MDCKYSRASCFSCISFRWTVPPFPNISPSKTRILRCLFLLILLNCAMCVSVPAAFGQGKEATRADFGEFAANGFVSMKVLDAEEKMTGFYITVELGNNTSEPINPYNFRFEMFNQGYYQGAYSGSSISGAERDLASGLRTKLSFGTSQKADEMLVKFPKPGWKPLQLKLTGESNMDSVAEASPPKPTYEMGSTGNFQTFASNGRVRMKMLDAEQKMTGFYMTVECVNETAEKFDPYYVKFSFLKEGFSNGAASGSGVYGADIGLPPGRRMKLQFSNSDKVDEIQVTFPKPGWNPLTLRIE